MAKICIDPGHYKKQNRSPGIPEYYESEMVWKLSQMQKKYLEQLGHTVILTRTDPNKDLGLTERGKKSKGCDLFISNHSNAVGGGGMNESVSHVTVYRLVNNDKTTCDEVSAKFAEKIAPTIANVMGLSYKIPEPKKASSDRNKDGVLNDNYYGVLHGASLVQTPGLILEHGFHTNTKTVKWLLRDENLERLAQAEAECIDRFFKENSENGGYSGSDKPAVPKQPVPNSTNFKVRVSITNLNIRTGPSVDYSTVGYYINPGVYTIIEKAVGKGSTKGWGKLKSKVGWISLDFVELV